MVSFDINEVRFQLRAAAVIREEGYVLLHRLDGDLVWALPGGRVEAGEIASAAAVREMQEELAEKLECNQLLFTVENYFEHNGTHHHEVGFYFQAALSPDSLIRNKNVSYCGLEGDVALEFRWFQLAELADVNLRPAFLCTALAENPTEHRHIVHKD